MRYSRLLAWLLLLFVVLGIGAQLLRHALPNGSFKTGTVSRTATSGIGAAASAAGTVASLDGAFTGTTQEILRWTACKWGIDENLVYAQAAVESWWRQTTQGDFGSDASACAPGHGLGADGQAGQCPQSFGILQNRYPFARSTRPGIARSTAMNADTAYGIWRACFEGYEHWLNDVERGRQYGAGDALGCMGRWFSGRWHTAPAEQYVAKVKDYLARRIWETPDFQEL
jgi:autotransporter family porin